jgi:putative ATP-dependent endonuclease of OLD family
VLVHPLRLRRKTITRVNGQLKRVGLDSVDKLPNVSVIDGKTDYEGHLIATGYIDAIEDAFKQALGEGDFDRYIAELDGKPGRKIDGRETTRDYKGTEGRKRAARDLLDEKKTRLAKSIATAIVALHDEGRRRPPAIQKLSDRIAEDLKED